MCDETAMSLEDEGMESDLITLMDDDGTEHEFEVLDSAEFEGREYMALVPVYDKPEELLDDTGELVILRIVEEDGEEFLEAIEDDEEFEKVGDFFTERLSDEYEFEN